VPGSEAIWLESLTQALENGLYFGVEAVV